MACGHQRLSRQSVGEWIRLGALAITSHTPKMAIPAAKILEQRSYLLPGKLTITEYLFESLRDYANPSTGTLRLFARGVRKHETPVEPEDESTEDSKKKQQLPWLCYLQGGPGMEIRPAQVSSPLARSFLDKGYQMLFLDQVRSRRLASTYRAMKSMADLVRIAWHRIEHHHHRKHPRP